MNSPSAPVWRATTLVVFVPLGTWHCPCISFVIVHAFTTCDFLMFTGKEERVLMRALEGGFSCRCSTSFLTSGTHALMRMQNTPRLVLVSIATKNYLHMGLVRVRLRKKGDRQVPGPVKQRHDRTVSQLIANSRMCLCISKMRCREEFLQPGPSRRAVHH